MGGAVRRPGVYAWPAESKFSLIQAITAAGGITPKTGGFVNEYEVIVWRRDAQGEAKSQTHRARGVENFVVSLEPGDVVIVVK
jgi:protein involved in polysaccharide export with SLBB domain